MRAELDDDLPGLCRLHESRRTLHGVVERLGRGQAREHDLRLGADVGRRPRRHAADLLEFGERGAAKPDHAIAAFDEIFRDRQAYLADSDEAYGLHGTFPLSIFLMSL